MMIVDEVIEMMRLARENRDPEAEPLALAFPMVLRGEAALMIEATGDTNTAELVRAEA